MKPGTQKIGIGEKMDYREYAETVKNIEVPKCLEFKEPIMWLLPEWMTRGLVSIGDCDMKVIKVPPYVIVRDERTEHFKHRHTIWSYDSTLGIEEDDGYERCLVPVITISKLAFAGNESITDIILPSSIERIPKGSFAGCRNLKNITIPKKVKTIYEGTFEGCDSLENIFYEGTMEDWKKVEIVHQKHEIEFGDPIPGTSVWEILSEKMVNIPGNEAVLSANIHFRCKLDDASSPPRKLTEKGREILEMYVNQEKQRGQLTETGKKISEMLANQEKQEEQNGD